MARTPRQGGEVAGSMFFVYILQSSKDNHYYIGSCQDISERLLRHNSGRENATKHRLPLKLIYSEEYNTRALAMKREKQIKSYKGGNAFKKLISECSSDG